MLPSMKKRSPPAVLSASLTVIGFLIALAGCATTRSFVPIPIVGQEFRIPPDFRIVGYLPSWSGEPADIQYEALTHINYAFLTPTRQGGYEAVARRQKLMELVALAHAYGVKVLASLGGSNDGNTDAFETIAADAGIASVFVDSTLSLVDDFQLDGIDMDWEFPSMDAADNYAALMHTLAERLHTAGKLLTAAVSADASHGSTIRDSVISDVDFLNIMAYDDGYRQPGVHHSSYDFALAAMRYWRNDRDVPASKVVLGVPFYGRSLKDRHSRTFKSIFTGDSDAPGKDISGDFGYNGFATLRDKTLRLARNLGGGIMIWQLAQDAPGTTSLLNSIFDAVKVPREQPDTPAPGAIVR
jgi:GH18 family chitinase